VLLGITPSGLNASSAGDLKVFYSYIASQQQHLYTPILSRLLNVIQLSLFGEIDSSIGFSYEPLWALDENEIANVRKAEAETDAVYIDRGVLSPEEARSRIANQVSSAYHGLDLSEGAAPIKMPSTSTGAPNDEPLSLQSSHAPAIQTE
jgi:hypothetical protein